MSNLIDFNKKIEERRQRHMTVKCTPSISSIQVEEMDKLHKALLDVKAYFERLKRR